MTSGDASGDGGGEAAASGDGGGAAAAASRAGDGGAGDGDAAAASRAGDGDGAHASTSGGSSSPSLSKTSSGVHAAKATRRSRPAATSPETFGVMRAMLAATLGVATVVGVRDKVCRFFGGPETTSEPNINCNESRRAGNWTGRRFRRRFVAWAAACGASSSE